MKEQWKNIKYADGYQISNKGRIRSIDRFIHSKRMEKHFKRFAKGKMLSTLINKNGREQIGIPCNHGFKVFLIGRIVSDHFQNKKNQNDKVFKINYQKSDESIKNVYHGQMNDHVVMQILEFNNNPLSRNLTPKDVIGIKYLLGNDHKHKDIAKIYDVTPECITMINSGARWNWL